MITNPPALRDACTSSAYTTAEPAGHSRCGRCVSPSWSRIPVSRRRQFDTAAGAGVSEYLLTVKLDNPLIARAALRIGGSDYAVDSKLAVLVVAAQRARDIPVSVAYRLYLKPGARAGVYPWPLTLAIAPRAI